MAKSLRKRSRKNLRKNRKTRTSRGGELLHLE